MKLGFFTMPILPLGRNLVETLMGAVVLAVAAVFLVFAYSKSGARSVAGYELTGKFNRVDGLTEGSDVRLSGIKIGTVTRQVLDPKTYLAVVTMSIKPEIKLPKDSSAQVSSDGLLGDKYLSPSRRKWSRRTRRWSLRASDRLEFDRRCGVCRDST